MVFGTDTGVGKTLVTATICAVAVAQGRAVCAVKPVQSGGEDDAGLVNRLAGAAVAMAIERLASPLAPAVAARLEGRRLRAARLLQAIRRVGRRADLVLTETAGGCAVELTDGYDMAQLAADLAYPALLVCRPGLGTLNHAVLSVEHLRRRGVDVAGLVISGLPRRPGLSELTNPPELERLTGANLLGVLPRVDTSRLAPPGFAARAATWIGPELGGTFDRERFLRRSQAQLLQQVG